VLRALVALVAIALSGAVVILAVANRQPVTLALPFTGGEPAATVPLYALLFLATAFGAVVGGFATWLGQRPARRAARAEKREAKRLRQELAAARLAPAALAPPAAARR
jgi:uncharacterized integral membrane protein